MHGTPTRAGQHRMGHRRKAVALLVGIVAWVVPADAAQNSDPMTTAAIKPLDAAHELQGERSEAGREGLRLAARLSVTGNLITRPIGWTVRRAVAADPASGETVVSREAAIADLKLEPGEYLVEASYGAVTVAQAFRLEPGRSVGLTLILNVGGVRALSTLQTLGMPANVVARHRLVGLSGPAAGREVVGAAGQGELLRLAAGAYRIESRFLPGNAIAETSVTVKPGVLSNVEISHLAGVARLRIEGGLTKPQWFLRAGDERAFESGEGRNPTLVLAPGAYVAEALVDGDRRQAAFVVTAGKTTQVDLID